MFGKTITNQIQIIPENYEIILENKENDFIISIPAEKETFEKYNKGDVLIKDDILNLK